MGNGTRDPYFFYFLLINKRKIKKTDNKPKKNHKYDERNYKKSVYIVRPRIK